MVDDRIKYNVSECMLYSPKYLHHAGIPRAYNVYMLLVASGYLLFKSLFDISGSAQQDGVLHAHALLVWGKCSSRLSELHTGFTDFSFFSLFFTWKHLRIHRSSFH